MRCSRGTQDQLARWFLARRVNLLETPRRVVDLGSVFAVNGTLVENLSSSEVFGETLNVEAHDAEASEIDEVSKKTTSDLDVETGASIVGRILAGLGIPSDEPKLSADLKMKGAKTVVLKILGLKIKRLRLTAVAKALVGREMMALRAPFADPKTRLYICTGTWAAKTLEFTAKVSSGQKVSAGAEMKELIELEGKLGVTHGAGAESLITSKERLVIGVELMRLDPGPDGAVLADFRPDQTVRGNAADVDSLAELAPDVDELFLRLN